MPKISYMGDGTTTEFNFNFPYFEDDNIIVTKNNESATGYTIVGTSAGLNADIPYTGGKIVFNVAPTALDNITISRSLPLTRIVDYQPTSKLDPTILNQDVNYLMEVIKDLKDALTTLYSQYSDIANKESTATLLTRISELSQQITALGDISTLRQNVTTNTNDITDMKNATNFTTSGKNKIANFGKPSNQYTDLTLGATWDQYTAPADGYICLRKSGDSGEYIKIYNVTSKIGSMGISQTGGFDIPVTVPVSKGDTFQITYTTSGATNYFRFVYANGAK